MLVQRILIFAILEFLLLPITVAIGDADETQAEKSQVLSKALKLAVKTEPLPRDEISILALYLGPEATNQRLVEALFQHVRERAIHSESAGEYADASTAASAILGAVDRIDSKKAITLFERWPTRPGTEDVYADFKEQFEDATQRNRLVRDPMNYLNENVPLRNTNGWLAVITGLQRIRPQDARDAFDRALAGCERQGGTCFSTIDAIVRLWPDFLNANLLTRYANLMSRSSAAASKFELTCDDRSAVLDYPEGRALRAILDVAFRQSETANQLLAAVPNLKEKTERVGGITAVAQRGRLIWKFANDHDQVVYVGTVDSKRRVAALCDKVGGSTDEARQTLAALANAKEIDLSGAM